MAISCPKGQVFNKKKGKCVVTHHKVESEVTDRVTDDGEKSTSRTRVTDLNTGAFDDDVMMEGTKMGTYGRSRMTLPSGEWYEEISRNGKAAIRTSKKYKKKKGSK